MKNKLRRALCLVLVCALLSGCAAVSVDEPAQPAAPAETEQPVAPAKPEAPLEGGLPQVGDTLSGFTVKQIVPMDALGATGVVFTHEKSGATLLYLASADTNRSFDITFRTPALDDKGKPHVFEHITICGSQKYPDANMFFPFANQTYSTFVNAITYHGMTSYPVASLSETQLMTMMDYYLSGVFQPLLYTEPKLAQREAWRYELTDADADMNIAGTVYSEMQGALTLSAQSRNNNIAALYAGSATAYESGGVPEHIRTLTYEELVEFHDTYYHPSNALITLYGDLDIARFLEYIDGEYLADFDKKDIHVEMGAVEPYTETKYAEYEAPVEKDAPTKNASEIYYSVALNGADMYDTFALTVLADVLLQESSPVMRALRASLPEAQVSGYVNFDSPSAPYLTFSAAGVDPEDRDAFVEAVDEGLKTLDADGISQDALDSVLATGKLSLLTTQEDKDLGVDASLAISLCWTYFNSLEYYPVYEKVLQEMNAQSADALIKAYITNNAHRAVSVTKPVAGLAEKNAAALAEKLAQHKASLSASDVDALVQSSADFIQWGNTPASNEVISKIVDMDVSSLPEEQRQYAITDETVDGVRYMGAVADVRGVCYGTIMLDGSTIPVGNLQDAQLCLLLLGQLDTKSHSKEELSTLITRYLSNFSASLDASAGYNGDGYYAAAVSWIGLQEDAQASMALVKEILFETDFSDTATIQGILARMRADFANGLDGSALNIQLGRCAAMGNDYFAYREYISNYDLYAHEQTLLELAKTDPAALTARLEAARALLLNRQGATVMCAGREEAVAAYEKGISDILSGMTAEKREAVDYASLRIPKRNEGIVNNSTVHMNVLFSDYANYSGKDAVVNMLINDTYLLPQLRNALGAYGAYSTLSRTSAFLYTYRDPNLAGSYEIFAALPEYLRTAALTQEDVDSYIIGSYSSLSRPDGLLSGAVQAMTDRMLGASEQMRLQWMKDAKATTAEDVAASAQTWEALVQNGARSASGTESALMEAADLFDALIYPDGSVKELRAQAQAAA